ncbi:sialidase family protein [Paenibacillus tuaregi]|uniref:sialidase family protein n=1 Tax=Paenibacillus tuaregi TaxID=1816681 RepID=UPI0009ED12CC|nr:sialidase family protein [Paenibacillus tuaregi]
MPVVNITAALPGNHFEPSIAVNSVLANFMCVVYVDDSLGTGRIGVSRSTDGGQTWASAILPQPSGYASAEAPTIDYTFPNTFIVACHVYNDFNDGTIVSYTSFDNGANFNPPVIVQRGYGTIIHNDEPFIAVDRSPGSPYRGNAYVSYTPLFNYSAIFIQRSLNEGASWETPQRLSDPRGFHDRAAVAIGLSGEVYSGYILTGPVNPEANLRISYNGGVSYYPDIARESLLISSVVPVPSPLPVTGYGFRVQTNLTLGADISSGLGSGNVYAAWNDYRNGYADIFLSISPDGQLWSIPKSITGAPPGTQNFFPAITVSPSTGTVRVIYYTNRVNGFLLDVFVAESFNGGGSFTNRRLTDASFDPNGNFPTPVALIGDYITAATSLPDTLAAVWNATTPPTGKQDIYFST